MTLKDDLRGYLLAIAVDADAPVGMSSEEAHGAFAADYPDFNDFDDAFTNALIWLSDENLVRYDSLPSGTNGECTVLGLVATSLGEKAVASIGEDAVRSTGLHVEFAKMVGAGLGEFVNTQK